MELLIGSMISFVLGVAVSWLFWRYLLYLKPSLHISEQVARSPSRKYPGKEILKFKIYNCTNRQAINLFVGCTISELANVPDGTRSRVIERLNVVIASFDCLGPKSNLGEKFGLSPVKVYTAQITDTFEQHIHGASARLILTLKASDAVSGSTIVVRKAYTSADVVRGEFRYGLTCDIVRSDTKEKEVNKSNEGKGKGKGKRKRGQAFDLGVTNIRQESKKQGTGEQPTRPPSSG